MNERYDFNRGNHFRIRRAFIRDGFAARLGASTCLIYFVLIDAANTATSEVNDLPIKDLAVLAGLSEKQAKISLAILEKYGFLAPIQRGSKGRGHATASWTLFAESAWQSPQTKPARADKGISRENGKSLPILENEKIIPISQNENNFPILSSENGNNIPETPAENRNIIPKNAVSNYIYSKTIINSNTTSSSNSATPPKTKREEEEECSFVKESAVNTRHAASFSTEHHDRIVNYYGLTPQEVAVFLQHNQIPLDDLFACLDAIRDPASSRLAVSYRDFQNRQIQRPLGFIFANRWIGNGRACPPTRFAPTIAPARTRANHAAMNAAEMQKTIDRLARQGVKL